MSLVIYPHTPDIHILESAAKKPIIIFDKNMTVNELQTEILKNGPVDHIGFVWNNIGQTLIPFIFSDVVLTPGIYEDQTGFPGESFRRLLRQLKEKSPFGTLIVDLITCDLDTTHFKECVKTFNIDEEITIRYSLDKTGNPQNGGDWIMESHNISIRDIYFNADKLKLYIHTLGTSTITIDCDPGVHYTMEPQTPLTTYHINDSGGTHLYTINASGSFSAPISFSCETLTLTGDGEWENLAYFILGDIGADPSGVTFDGAGHTISFTASSVTNFGGFFDMTNNCIVKNLHVRNDDGTGGTHIALAAKGGYIHRAVASNLWPVAPATDNTLRTFGGTIINCTVYGEVPDEGGGICGGNIGAANKKTINNAVLNIYNCSFTCAPDASNNSHGASGGIMGRGIPDGNSVFDICGCSSNHPLGFVCGGITGNGTAREYGTITISNCYSTGDCLSVGSLTGAAGGITGNSTGYRVGFIVIKNCYSTGKILAGTVGSGGIVGSSACGSGGQGGTGPGSPSWGGGTILIENCFSTGVIGSSSYNFECGGIVGPRLGDPYKFDPPDADRGNYPASVVIRNCYSTGNISDECGGIVGPKCWMGDISGCYSTGSISSTNTGGICAPPPVLYTDPPDTERCTIRHCYSNQVTGHLTLAPSTTGDLQATTPTEGMDGLYIEDISNGSLGITNAELGESSWQPGNTNLLDSSQNPMLKTFTDYTIWYTYNANGDISGSDPLEPYKEYDSIGNTLPDVSLNLLWEHLIPYGDLSSAYLINLDLSNLDLTGANLYYADISGADLTGVDASGTDCRIIQNIKYAILTNINLNNADFTSTDLSNVDFSPVATMEGVILNTADISAADFTGVDASGADCRNIQNIKYAILTDISLNNADFTSTDLSNVDFSPVATMEDVILNTADISAADFTGVNASGADCRNIQNIKYAILTNISLNNANFTSTDLSNVDFSPVATMEGVILNTADISAADFTGVDASGADCRNIQNIKYAILTNISLNNANFTNTDLSNVDFSPVATMEGVILNTADISAADFTGVNASGADCRNIQNIKYAILTNISLNNADFTNTDLSNVDFSPVATMANAILSGVDASGVNFTDVLLTNTDFSGADLTNTTLTGANFTGAILTLGNPEVMNVISSNLIPSSSIYGGGNELTLPKNIRILYGEFLIGQPNKNIISIRKTSAILNLVSSSSAGHTIQIVRANFLPDE